MIPPLKLTDSGQTALNWMDEFRVTQLPVVDQKKYIGLITEENILEKNDPTLLLSSYQLDFQDARVLPDVHYLDLLKKADQHKISLLPVTDGEGTYLGVVSVSDISSALAQMLNGYGPGGIIVLSMKERDYSLSQISRLVESNDAKILSSFVHNDKDPEFIKLTLKLNKRDLSRIIATLERHEYRILTYFQEGQAEDQDKDR
ncbi:MAG TPA: CBS domain-containing protein, partial [Cytophagaceae bacterium]|nr:CBS domain-containing protein [Cytophagaceae bacterium]